MFSIPHEDPIQGAEGWEAGGGEFIGETLPSKLRPHSSDRGTGHWDLQLPPILGVVFARMSVAFSYPLKGPQVRVWRMVLNSAG